MTAAHRVLGAAVALLLLTTSASSAMAQGRDDFALLAIPSTLAGSCGQERVATDPKNGTYHEYALRIVGSAVDSAKRRTLMIAVNEAFTGVRWFWDTVGDRRDSIVFGQTISATRDSSGDVQVGRGTSNAKIGSTFLDGGLPPLDSAQIARIPQLIDLVYTRCGPPR